MPAAAVIMFFSAMPKSKKRSGWRALNSTVRLALARSAVSTTIRGIAIGQVGQLLAEHEGRQARGGRALDRQALGQVGRAADAAKQIALVLACGGCLVAGHGQHPQSPAAAGARPALQLADHGLVVAADQIADMPVQAALHHLHAAALDGIGDDHLRCADAPPASARRARPGSHRSRGRRSAGPASRSCGSARRSARSP